MKKNITIFSPYIKATTLNRLLESTSFKCEQIIVRWEPMDLALGSSDIEVYKICKENSIALYMNNRIHLKLFTNNFNDALLGSANISERAISDSTNRFNYEVCTYVQSIDRDDRLYLHKIINESILVTDDIYDAIESQIPDISPDITNKTFKLPASTNATSDFLITKLPMIDNPTMFWELYSGKLNIESEEQENCLCHDLSLYEINSLIYSKKEFFDILIKNFFKLPFITEFLNEVNNSLRTTRNGKARDGLQFGAVRNWFAKNTTTAPTPRAYELTKNVQILYAWISFLSDGKYTIMTPGAHSQVIKKSII